uniref:Uncharacterized protein n=1 Tax=Anguilla anguilla TaxID=7936 RepID=A0A0E9UZ24_ANGAN
MCNYLIHAPLQQLCIYEPHWYEGMCCNIYRVSFPGWYCALLKVCTDCRRLGQRQITKYVW